MLAISGCALALLQNCGPFCMVFVWLEDAGSKISSSSHIPWWLLTLSALSLWPLILVFCWCNKFCRRIAQGGDYSWLHTLRKAKQVANSLAKFGFSCLNSCHIFDLVLSFLSLVVMRMQFKPSSLVGFSFVFSPMILLLLQLLCPSLKLSNHLITPII